MTGVISYSRHCYTKDNMKKPLVPWLLALAVAALCVVTTSYVHWHQAQQAKQQRRAEADKIVAVAWKNDSLPQSERPRLDRINDAVLAKQPITDDDLRFLLGLLTQTYNGRLSQIGRLTAAWSLQTVGTLSPSQKQIVQEALVPQLAPDSAFRGGPTDVQLSRVIACDILAGQSIRGAVPNMLPLLDDPNLHTRAVAKRDLRKLGYAVP